MMNKKLLLALFISALFTTTNAQDQTLMTINGKPVSKSEFEYLYKKNNSSVQQTRDDYMKLFIDYKLKVEEAKSLKLDTLPEFVTEYNNYKNQITQSYLIDTLSEQTVAKKIFARQKEYIDASYIIVQFKDRHVLPKDTLEAYNKALSIRDMLVGRNAKNFENVALEYSEDPSVKKMSRPGHLGWATSGSYVLPFEEAMYSLSKGETSQPIRTIFGYILLRVNDRKPNPGSADISHIWLPYPENATEQQIDSVQSKAQEIHKMLTKGGDFAEICKTYSSDKRSAENGGQIGTINLSARMDPSIKDAIFALNDKNIFTQPLKGLNGYQIIKLNKIIPDTSTWDGMKKELILNAKSTDFMFEVKSLMIDRLSNKLNYKLNKKTYSSLDKLAHEYLPIDSAYIANIEPNKVLFSINNKQYSTSDFAEYLKSSASARSALSTEILSLSFNDFLLEKLQQQALVNIEETDAEFKNILQEYHDGILLFNVMNSSVWDKAANDDESLAKCFEKNKAKYVWEEPRYKGHIIYCNSEESASLVKEFISKSDKNDDLSITIPATFNNDSTKMVVVRKGLWTKGDNKIVDNIIYNQEVEIPVNNNYPIHFVEGQFINAPEDYTDVKGLVISDLQEIKEREWIESLRNKYKVVINNKVLETIK